MKNRLFIVAPTDAGVDVGDTLHQVCGTNARGSFFDIYQNDQYADLASCGSLDEAKAECVRRGAKRPFVLR